MHRPTDSDQVESHLPCLRRAAVVPESRESASSVERARRRRRAGKPRPVSGKTDPGGWARNWARVRRHLEPMNIARSGEVGGSTEHPTRVIPTGGTWSQVRAGASDDLLAAVDLPALSTPSTKRPRTDGCDGTDGLAIGSEVFASEASPRRPRRMHVRDLRRHQPTWHLSRTRGSTTMTAITTESAVRPHPCRRPSSRIRRAICRAVASNARSKRLTDERPGRDVKRVISSSCRDGQHHDCDDSQRHQDYPSCACQHRPRLVEQIRNSTNAGAASSTSSRPFKEGVR